MWPNVAEKQNPRARVIAHSVLFSASRQAYLSTRRLEILQYAARFARGIQESASSNEWFRVRLRGPERSLWKSSRPLQGASRQLLSCGSIPSAWGFSLGISG